MLTTGAQIRAARAALGWSQGDLAERASLHPKSVAYWERHASFAPATKQGPNAALAKIAAALAAEGVEAVAAPHPGIIFRELAAA